MSNITNRTDLLNYMINRFSYQSYLEIGCETNANFNAIKVFNKIGVDPNEGGTHRCTSDAFFDGICPKDHKFDLIFIDGLHECQQVNRDLTNALQHLNDNGTIVLHDCHPEREDEATYPPQTNRERTFWNGDVWKAIVLWRTYTHVDIVVSDFDWGCGIVRAKPNSDPYKLDQSYLSLSWDYFIKNKQKILRLMNSDQIAKWL